MVGNFSFEQAYSQDLISNSYHTENLDKEHFNIAVAADWGCEEDTEKTVENIQEKDPELVISAGDASYEESADCWFEIIQPLKSKMKIAMGDHEYSDTSGGEKGIIDQYLEPLNLEKTYYSFDMNNVHVTVIDPFIDYDPDSPQYQFIENDLKAASINPNIDWTFVVESVPIYTSASDHAADSTIRDIYHPLFDNYGVDLVFSSDNHNYQRTFPINYNGNGDSSDSPIITDRDPTSYNIDSGVIYLIIGTGGRSLYEIEDQASFVANQYDKQFGFLNIDIYSDKALRGTFYVNEDDSLKYYPVSNTNDNIADHFIISNMKVSGAKEVSYLDY
ncbi:MAG TPA: metallophosphoesterase [Nitrososphaeraceae archaeon]|nr:metallophosphoesterase [Nitrososphaeraceae archaeon]